MGEFLANLIKGTLKWVQKNDWLQVQGFWWLKKNGDKLDWLAQGGPYSISKDSGGSADCPTFPECKSTYWLCGECVHDHWIGNFMFGFLGRALKQPDYLTSTAGHVVQMLSGSLDAPWDRAGYKIGRSLATSLMSGTNKSTSLCALLMKDKALWKQANNLKRPDTSDIILYPTPHTSHHFSQGLADCKRCPVALPKSVLTTVPGGKFRKTWPGY